jgi:hypothetical protein
MAHAQETGEVLLALIIITDESIVDGPLRLVQDLQPLTSNGNVYTAFPFEVRLPADRDAGPAKVLLTIDNIDRSIAVALRSIPPSSPPTVTIDLVIASQPDTIELSMPDLTLRTITGDALQIEGELRMDEEDLTEFPEGSFTPQVTPGLFR